MLSRRRPESLKKGFSLIEVLISGSLAVALSSLLLGLYWDTHKRTQIIQAKADADMLVYQIADKMMLDLYKTSSQGVRYDSSQSNLWIRQLGSPTANGQTWERLVGYRLESGFLRRYQSDLKDPMDSAFPEEMSALATLWSTPPTTSAALTAFKVHLKDKALELEFHLDRQQYLKRLDFRL